MESLPVILLGKAFSVTHVRIQGQLCYEGYLLGGLALPFSTLPLYPLPFLTWKVSGGKSACGHMGVSLTSSKSFFFFFFLAVFKSLCHWFLTICLYRISMKTLFQFAWSILGFVYAHFLHGLRVFLLQTRFLPFFFKICQWPLASLLGFLISVIKSFKKWTWKEGQRQFY